MLVERLVRFCAAGLLQSRPVGASFEIPWQVLVTLVTVAGYLMAFLLIPRILLSQKEAGATFAWILVIAFLPWLGALLFFLIGRTRVRRRAKRKVRYRVAINQSLQGIGPKRPCCEDSVVERLAEPGRSIARVAVRLSEGPIFPGNAVDVFVEGERCYAEMERAILGAERNVHLMTYIYREDEAGLRFREAMMKKAREGLEVRLLVDGFGSHALGRRFVRPLEEAGAHFARFMPVLPFSPHWRPNLRNHRKILVVDGRVGFTGGLNIGDEYRGRKRRLGPWRDTHLRLCGPAVWRLQETFAEDWFFATRQDLISLDHFPAIAPAGEDLVQVVDSGPDHAHENIHAVFFTAISRAERSIFITTPYFVPDPAMLEALKTAAFRGVDVRLLLPGRSDMRLVQVAGRSFFRELLDAGVRIWEHRPGVLHAKTMVIDGSWSTVGSANMDIRSFRLNFECNVLVTGASFAERMQRIFEDDLARARPVTLEAVRRKTVWRRLSEGFARALSPVL